MNDNKRNINPPVQKEDELDFLNKMEKRVYTLETCHDLSLEYDIAIPDLCIILKSNNLEPESSLSNSQKRMLINYLSVLYHKYFEIEEPKTEKVKLKKNRKSSTKLRKHALSQKKQLLSKLKKGFQNNVVGEFEIMRVGRIKKLQNEIDLLNKTSKKFKKKKSDFKKPKARIIYTPMGGKVD